MPTMSHEQPDPAVDTSYTGQIAMLKRSNADLLEALKAAQEAIEDLEREVSHFSRSPLVEKATKQIEQAIARAEGR